MRDTPLFKKAFGSVAASNNQGVTVTKPDLAPFREEAKAIDDDYVGKAFGRALYDLVQNAGRQGAGPFPAPGGAPPAGA